MVTVPRVSDLPEPNFSWLQSLAQAGGDVVDHFSNAKSMSRLADLDQKYAQPQPQGGFLSSLMGQQQPAAPQTAPVTPVERGAIPDAYYGAIRAAESGGNDAARNPRSSATGRYQFTEGTWSDLARRRPELALTADGRLDPSQQERAVRAFTQENASALSRAGVPVNPGSLYAAHFLGAGGATNVLGQADDASMASVVGPEVIQANPFLDGMTVGQFRQWAASKGSNDRGGYSAPSVDAVNELAAGQRQGGNIIAPGVTPMQRGGADPEMIRELLRDPQLNQIGRQLWQANVEGQKPTEPWQFVTLPDGTLARANQQTGQIESVGRFSRPVEQYRVLSPQERQQYGIPQDDNRPYQISPQGQIAAVGGVGQAQAPGVEARQREQLAQQYGIDPNSAEGQRFILTGTLPTSDKGVTAGDREAIREADDLVNSGEATLSLINRARDLSDKAYEGMGAGGRALIASQFGNEAALATREFDNIVTEQALGQLKAIFGGAPTEGERAILLDIQGSSSQPKAVRKAILERAAKAVERRIAYNRDKAAELRGGNYYKPRENQSGASGNATTGGVKWSIEE